MGTHELIREHEDGLEGKVPVAHAEEILEGGPEEVDDHDVVVALLARPVDPGHTGTTHQSLVDLALLLERRRLGNRRLELDGDFLACDGVHALEDGAWCGEQRERNQQSEDDAGTHHNHRWQSPLQVCTCHRT